MTPPDLGPYGRPARPLPGDTDVVAPASHPTADMQTPGTGTTRSSSRVDATATVTNPTPSPPRPAAAATTPASADSVTITVDRISAAGAGIALAVVAGCLGPWITLGPFTRSGLDSGGDSLVALVAGVLGGLLVATKRNRIVTAVLGLIVTAVAVVDGLDVSNRGDDLLSPSPGWGLYVVGLAGVALFASSLVRRSDGAPAADASR